MSETPLFSNQEAQFSFQNHHFYMNRCLDLAQEASQKNEVPVGALIVDHTGVILSETHNLKENSQIATKHAEILAIEEACKKRGSWRLHHCSLYVTLEPCFMCAGAIVLARIPSIIFATPDPKAGAVESLARILTDHRLNHQCQVISGVCANKASALLKDFFKARRISKQVVL
jgi:tRNA(adenine34) deaminase